MRQAQGQNNQAMGFGKSKARLYGQDKEKVVFADVAGNDNAKQDLHEVVDFETSKEIQGAWREDSKGRAVGRTSRYW